MQIVILAAGQGTRLHQGGRGGPKSLVRIAGDKLYLQYQLEEFVAFNPKSIVIVGGHEIHELKNFLNEFNSPLITLIENKDYKKGNVFSLLSAQKLLDDDFFIFNADHFYSHQTYQKIFAHKSNRLAVFCDKDRALTDDDMKAIVNEHGVTQMSKQLDSDHAGYVGVTSVPKMIHERYWQQFPVVIKDLGESCHVESIVNAFAAQDGHVDWVDVSGSWWTEIDTPEDLQRAKDVIMTNCPITEGSCQ